MKVDWKNQGETEGFWENGNIRTWWYFPPPLPPPSIYFSFLTQDSRGLEAAACTEKPRSEGFHAEIMAKAVLLSVLSQELSRKAADSEKGLAIRNLCIPRWYHSFHYYCYSISSFFVCVVHSFILLGMYLFTLIISDWRALGYLQFSLIDSVGPSQVWWMLLV